MFLQNTFTDDARGYRCYFCIVLCFFVDWIHSDNLPSEYHPDDTDQSDDVQFMDIRLLICSWHDSNVAKLHLYFAFSAFPGPWTDGRNAQILTFVSSWTNALTFTWRYLVLHGLDVLQSLSHHDHQGMWRYTITREIARNWSLVVGTEFEPMTLRFWAWQTSKRHGLN